MNLNASDYVVFVDESGDHSLESINPEWPLFVLSFCIFPVDKYVQEVTQAIRSLKFDFFGHDLVSLHEHDIRKKKGAFSQLNEEARDDFLNHLSMQFGLERLADFLAINGQQGRETRVICEARGAKKDPDPLPLLSCIKCCQKKTA